MSETTASPELQAATERMMEAYKVYDKAQQNAWTSEAEVARLRILDLAEQIPGMNGMTFECQYEYDDEGGYFRTISCYPTFEDEAADYDQYDFYDYVNAFNAEAICILCGVPTDAYAGETTLEALRRGPVGQPGD